MQIFDFLSVAVSIVVGLALTHTLEGISRLIQARGRVKVYWVHLLWVVGILMLQIQYWWGAWLFNAVTDWTLSKFGLFLVAPIFLFVAGDMMFPDLTDPSNTSMWDYYYEKRRSIFGLLIAYFIAASVNISLIRESGNWLLPSHGFRLAGVAIMLVNILTDSPRVHAILAIVAVVSFALFIVLLN